MTRPDALRESGGPPSRAEVEPQVAVSYNAIQFVSEWEVRDRYGIEHVTVKDVRVDDTGTNVLVADPSGHGVRTPRRRRFTLSMEVVV